MLAGDYAKARAEAEGLDECECGPNAAAFGLVVLAVCAEATGYYSEAIKHLQQASRIDVSDPRLSLTIRSNLANDYYSLGQIVEAEGIACSLIVELDDLAKNDDRRQTLGFAHYVVGNCHRVLAAARPSDPRPDAERAAKHLARAAEILDDYRAWGNNENNAATAHTSRGALLEVETMLGRVTPDDAIAQFEAAMDEAERHSDSKRWAESVAWWCIYGANVVLRHVMDEERLERMMAIFTNKADELAELTGNWSLRERVWTLEHMYRVLRNEGTLKTSAWTLDADDLKVLTGAMGRFPVFREAGWQILQSVRGKR
jgi:tetratricopeptide (TPR) repeat protein